MELREAVCLKLKLENLDLIVCRYTLDDTDTYEPTMDECVAPAVF